MNTFINHLNFYHLNWRVFKQKNTHRVLFSNKLQQCTPVLQHFVLFDKCFNFEFLREIFNKMEQKFRCGCYTFKNNKNKL